MAKSKVYVRIDDANRILCVEGGRTESNIHDFSEWVLVDEGNGIRYDFCQNNYLQKPIKDARGIFRYKLVDGAVQERTQEEMDADYAARPVPEMTDMELLLETAADHEYRLCLMELGVTEE